jgi:hypothetical protein
MTIKFNNNSFPIVECSESINSKGVFTLEFTIVGNYAVSDIYHLIETQTTPSFTVVDELENTRIFIDYTYIRSIDGMYMEEEDLTKSRIVVKLEK